MSIYYLGTFLDNYAPTKVVVELGFGDVASTVIKSKDSIFWNLHSLDKPIGVGNVVPDGEIEKTPMEISFSFPTDSVDSLDAIITGLQNIRDKYYKDAPQKITRETNKLRPVIKDKI